MCLIWKNYVFLDSFQELWNCNSAPLILLRVPLQTQISTTNLFSKIGSINYLLSCRCGHIPTSASETIFGSLPVCGGSSSSGTVCQSVASVFNNQKKASNSLYACVCVHCTVIKLLLSFEAPRANNLPPYSAFFGKCDK